MHHHFHLSFHSSHYNAKTVFKFFPLRKAHSTKQHKKTQEKGRRSAAHSLMPPTLDTQSSSYSQRLLPQQTAAFIIPLCVRFTFTSVLEMCLMNNMSIFHLSRFGVKKMNENVEGKVYIL